MKSTSRMRNFARTSLRVVLLAGAAALAVTTSGCIVDDSGPGYGGECATSLFVDWQIQNSAHAPVTCAAAGAATVLITVDTVDYQPTCTSGSSEGSYQVPIQGSGTYNITVGLYDANGNSLAPALTTSLDSCVYNETPTPAVLVVSPASP